MLNIVCFRWKPAPGYRSKFAPATVNTLQRMLARHYPKPHRLICITDDAHGIEPPTITLPLWKDHADLYSPHGRLQPSCYRRLKIFAPEMRELIGERIAMIDLDVVICRDMSPIFDRTEDFLIWGDTARGTPYNGSLMLMTAGARSKVWTDFDPKRSPMLGLAKHYIGSDQAWIGACLGTGEKKFTMADGVYSYRNQIAPKGNTLPADARIVIFHGHVDPWEPVMQYRCRWIGEHYR